MLEMTVVNFSDTVSLCPTDPMNCIGAGLILQKTRGFLLSHNECKGQVTGLIWMTSGDIMSQGVTRQPDVGGELSVDPFIPSIPIHSNENHKAGRYLCVSPPWCETHSRLMAGLAGNPTVGPQTAEPSNVVKLS